MRRLTYDFGYLTCVLDTRMPTLDDCSTSLKPCMNHGDVLDWHVHVVNFALEAETLNEAHLFSLVPIDELYDLPADALVRLVSVERALALQIAGDRLTCEYDGHGCRHPLEPDDEHGQPALVVFCRRQLAASFYL